MKASTRKLLLLDELDVDELFCELLVDYDVKLGDVDYVAENSSR